VIIFQDPLLALIKLKIFLLYQLIESIKEGTKVTKNGNKGNKMAKICYKVKHSGWFYPFLIIHQVAIFSTSL
jgi:hypothetical protein